MPLISKTSDLTSLKFGNDRRGGGKSGQPFITERIPERDRSINFANSFLGNDFLIRGGVTSAKAVLQDGLRLTKFLTSLRSPNGFLFITKQQLLSQQNPLTGASPSRIYLPTNTLAQAGVNPIGKHFSKQGIELVIDDNDKYFKLTKTAYNTRGTNKLLLLHETNLSSTTPIRDLTFPVPKSDLPGSFFRNSLNSLTNSLSSFALSIKNAAIPPLSVDEFENNIGRFGISQDPTILFDYQGGPNSSVGTKTKIRRVFNTNEGIERNTSFESPNKYLTYTPGLLVKKSRIGNTGSTSFGTEGIRNFEKDLLDITETGVSEGRRKQLIGEPTDYTTFNRSVTYGEGDPGKKGRDRSVYYSTDLTKISPSEAADIYSPNSINAQPLYRTADKSAKKGPGYDDLIKFNIGVLDLESTGETRNTTWIHFATSLQSFNDAFQATWNSINYMGRGNTFYKYGGYTRDISMDFKVVVYSKYEQALVYDKLNYLASIIAPNYSVGGFMRGNLIKLTIGDYLNNVTGILKGFNFSIPQDSPWDIGRVSEETDRGSNGREDSNALQLPMIIDVSGFSFTPLHNFRDRSISSNYLTEGKPTPDQRYLSLGEAGKGYTFTKFLRDSANNVQSESES